MIDDGIDDDDVMNTSPEIQASYKYITRYAHDCNLWIYRLKNITTDELLQLRTKNKRNIFTDTLTTCIIAEKSKDTNQEINDDEVDQDDDNDGIILVHRCIVPSINKCNCVELSEYIVHSRSSEKMLHKLEDGDAGSLLTTILGHLGNTNFKLRFVQINKREYNESVVSSHIHNIFFGNHGMQIYKNDPFSIKSLQYKLDIVIRPNHEYSVSERKLFHQSYGVEMKKIYNDIDLDKL